MTAEIDPNYREIFKRHEFFINPERIDLDRLDSRKPPDEGIIYDFSEQQDSETHLFPTEMKVCGDLLKNCETYLDDKDLFKIKIAMSLSLYGHQRQFRKSGEPYMIHPFAMAKEAAEVYKADWQTVSLCLLHDLLEDSPKYGHEVKAEWVADIYREVGYGKEGLLLVQSMEIMNKIASESGTDGLPKDVATVRKLYDVFLSADEDNYGLLRVLLVKLLDRKHNLETIRYVPKNKRNEVIDETLRVYVNMAGALHLYKLQDELVALSMKSKYPQMAGMIDGLINITSEANRAIASGDSVVSGTKSVLSSDPDVRRWWSDDDCNVALETPRITEVRAATQGRHPRSKLRLQVIIPQKLGEGVEDWIEKAQACFNVLQFQQDVEVLNPRGDRLTFDRDKYRSQRVLSADVAVAGVPYSLEFIGRDFYIFEQASLLHLFSKGREYARNNEEFRRAVFSHILEIRDSYQKARESGLLAPFFETVAGANVVEWKGIAHRFPENASVLDVLYTVIGQNVFRVHSVRVRSSRGKEYFLSGELLYARLHTGDEIVEYLTIPFNTAVPDWLDHVAVESVKAVFRDYFAAAASESVVMKEMAQDRGKRRLKEIYNGVWQEMLKKDRDDGIQYQDYELTFKFLDEAQNFDLPDKKLLPAVVPEYANKDDFIFQLGLDRVDADMLDKVRTTYYLFRQNRIAIEIPAGQGVLPDKLEEAIRNRGVALLDSRIVETNDGFIMFVWFSTEELGGRNARDTFHKLKNLLERLEVVVRGKKGDVLPFNIYLRSTDDNFRSVLRKKGHGLRMRIMHND